MNETYFVVECDDFRVPTPFKTYDDAERVRVRIETAGHCKLSHRIVEVHRTPLNTLPPQRITDRRSR